MYSLLALGYLLVLLSLWLAKGEALSSLLGKASLPEYTQQALLDPLSPQSKAYAWLSNHSLLLNASADFPYWEQEQAFAVVTFLHAFNISHWVSPSTFSRFPSYLDYSVPLCYWAGIPNPAIRCTEDGKLTQIMFRVPTVDQEPVLYSTIPPQVALLTDLYRFEIHEAETQVSLEEFLPTQMATMANLTSFELWGTHNVGTIPSQLHSFLPIDLARLVLVGSDLTGTLPSTMFTALSQLKHIQFEWNSGLTGSIPSQVGLLTRLTHLSLFNNNLSGQLPTQIGMLQSLTEFSPGSNVISGPIPSQIGLLSNLRTLYLHNLGDLSGTIPTQLGQLSGIKTLNCAENPSVHGPIPSELGLLSSDLSSSAIWHIYLFGNSLNSTIPVELFAVDMFNLRLSQNALTGPIPSQIGNATSLVTVELYNNHLSGQIPSSLAPIIPTLQLLDLSNNNLSGQLPATFDSIDDATNLRSFNLRFNDLAGTLSPEFVGSLVHLSDLQLTSNRFSGNIPSTIGLLNETLRELNLEDNLFSGSIPLELHNLSKLRTLRLGQNRLSGTLHSEFGSLPDLNTLSVFNNSLEGTLPTEFGFAVNTLELYGNLLTGQVPSEFCQNYWDQVLIDCNLMKCPEGDCRCECM